MREFKSIEEQLEILKNRNLTVLDEDLAKKRLEEDNYYNVINGYKKLFITCDALGKEKFITNATFEEIYALYSFDRELRTIVFQFILKLENVLRTQIAYVFSKYHNSDNYLIYDNFENYKNDTNANEKTVSKRVAEIYKLIVEIQNAISKNIGNKDYIRHYVVHDGNIPLWVVVNILTLGTIGKYYSLMKQSERVEIAKHWNVGENELSIYFHAMAFFRNLCAHDDRIYCSKFNTDIPDTDIHRKLNLSVGPKGYNEGKNDLFALLVILKKLLPEDEFRNFYNKINGRIISLTTKLTSITIDIVQMEMGFPPFWRSIKSV